MAVEPWILKEDGYLNVDVALRRIVYHPTLNVVLLCTENGEIRVLDVNSGVVLHSTSLTAQDASKVQCKYIFGQDRVVFTDGFSLGARSDYNGVLLLDTILQKPVTSARDVVQIELLLSEAQILKQSLLFAAVPSLDYVVNELTDKIQNASKNSKKGIKAQKWNTVCLELPLEYLRTATDSTITEMLLKNQHTPELSVAAAVQERLSELVGESSSAADRRAMASEAKRRETFTHWPHMDYKWALPDQMAQAGFYHQPNQSGDDRAMCFTCTVCLVCWERTDEPWSEHERHSPTCPFVLGEYTHNVPLSATLATTPAADATYRGVATNVLGSSSVPNLIPTSNKDGLVSVFDITAKVTRTHSFYVTHFDSHLLDRVTMDFGAPGLWSENSEVLPLDKKKIHALALVGQKSPPKPTLNPPGIRPSIIVGLTLKFKRKVLPTTVETLNQHNADMQTDVDMEASTENEPIGTYLVVYDFTYKKQPITSKNERDKPMDESKSPKTWNIPQIISNDNQNGSFGVFGPPIQDGGLENPLEFTFISKPLQEFENYLYQSYVPGESDKICLPTAPTQRQVPMDVDSSETDSVQSDLIINSKKSISDHISELKNARVSKKLNYSKAVQCVPLPPRFKGASHLEITEILPSCDGSHILVVLKSKIATLSSVLIVYSLDFEAPVVRLKEFPVCVRVLEVNEAPEEVSMLISQLERPTEGAKSSGDGMVILVCADGAVRVLDLLTLKIVSVAKLESERFVSAAYCNSLERLCASSENGSLHFYALSDTDNESTEDHEEDDIFSLYMDFATNSQALDSWDSADNSRCFQEPPTVLSDTELERLQPLMHFEPSKPGYCAVVPPCWSEMQQLQRQRRIPQLNADFEPQTKTWRLQTDTTTWDEHVFEITLPTPATIGHIDVHFTLHNSTNHPHVELTLLRQNTNSIGHKKFQVDEHIILDAFQETAANPVTTNEYLRAHNADILAGPIDIRSGLDLTDLSGIVTLTSPKLFKSRNRTFLLHFKSVQTENGKNSTRKTEYIGCDCIHELSVTIYVSKHTDIPHERLQRLAMIESNNFAQSLCLTAFQDAKNTNYVVKNDNSNQSKVETNTRQGESSRKSEIINLKKAESSTTNETSKRTQVSSQNDVKKTSVVDNAQKNNVALMDEFSTSKKTLQTQKQMSYYEVAWEQQYNDYLAPFAKTKGNDKCFDADMYSDFFEMDEEEFSTAQKGLPVDQKSNISSNPKPDEQFGNFFANDESSTSQKALLLENPGLKQATEEFLAANASYSKNEETPNKSTYHEEIYEPEATTSNKITVPTSKLYLRNLSLDILNFIASIRLNRLRNAKGEPPTYQLEFVKIIESQLNELVLACLVRSTRSTGFKLMKLLVTCLNGAQNISETLFEDFCTALLAAILNAVNVIFDVKSPSNLNNLVVLLSYISKHIEVDKLGAKCLELLTKISNELSKRSNPYHLILRSRFGLFGTPFEPELFDLDVCYPQKNSSASMSFSLLFEGTNVSDANKEFLDAKEVFSGWGLDGKSSSKSTTGHRKLVHGLLEAEPLHFSCISASDGTRVEKADLGNSAGVSSGLMPITVTHMNGGTKKIEDEQWDHFVLDEEAFIANNTEDGISFCKLQNKTPNPLAEDSLMLTVLPVPSNVFESSSKPAKRVEETINPNKSLPWQQLLVTPTLQVIVVERMHSGARRFVTLDFGQPVVLTDVLIPFCSDLVTVSVDLWLKGEELDGFRLVTSSDIGTKNLIMTDLQPPPLCRYMKIITVGRYGMSNTRCRIPLGQFYGHLIVLPEEIPTEHYHYVPVPTLAELQTQLNVLNVLFEDVNCRYSLACSKLKELLQPLVASDISNGGHLAAFMETSKEKPNSDNSKILSAYQEAITYQRQLNTVKNVVNRLENGINTNENNVGTIKKQNNVTIIKVEGESTSNWEKSNETILTASTDKLRSIAEALLEVLLSTEANVFVPRETATNIFSGFCVSEKSRLQFLAAMMLDKFAKKQNYWGDFLNGTLREMFASSYSSVFPQDRVFVLLAYLVRRSANKSMVLDSTMRIVADVLEPLLNRQRGTLLAVAVDLPLLGWALLLLALQLDVSKNYGSIRWDWITGEMSSKSPEESSASHYKKKLQKRNLQYKQQLDSLEITHKVVQSSAQVQALSALSNHAAHLTHKLEAALKQQQNFLKKMKQIKSSKTSENVAKAASQAKPKRKNVEDSATEKEQPALFVAKVDSAHCLVVIKRLFALLLNVDHSCSADMFLLACKVIARLVRLSGCLTLRHLLSHNELLKLVNLCLKSELSWAPHALSCLLQDILNMQQSSQELPTDPSATPSNWGSTQDFLVDVDKLYKTLSNEETILNQNPCFDQIIMQPAQSASASGTLPSVFESDDSDLEDMLDDILERGRTLLKKPIKKLMSSNFSYSLSSAVDSRLELGVEWQSEVSLKRLVTINSLNLSQNLVGSPADLEDPEVTFTHWPESLTIEIESFSPKLNVDMLFFVFEKLFSEAPSLSANTLGNVLELWLTLNVGGSANAEDKFRPGINPSICLTSGSIRAIVSAIAWNPMLPLKTWVCGLQALTLVCNQAQNCSDWSDDYGLYAMTADLVEHPDFQQLLLALLSGTGIINLDKGLAGPSLCKALHDLLVRLQLRCDVVSPFSSPGNHLKSLLLRVLYQLEQPIGPLASRTGPLDVQCKFLQSMLHLDYANADLSIVISILEYAGLLVLSYVNQADRIKCMNIGERLNTKTQSFCGIFASVLGTDPNKQDRPVNWEFLLVALLKLLGKLVQTPVGGTQNDQHEPMETDATGSSQTDESKAEQAHQDPTGYHEAPRTSCLADSVLQHRPSISQLCLALSKCQDSSLSMLANISQNTFADLGEPTTVADGIFYLLGSLAKKCSRSELIIEPIVEFLKLNNKLSEPLIWFILQVVKDEESLQTFIDFNGIQVLCCNLVSSSDSSETLVNFGAVSMVMQHFLGTPQRSDAGTVITTSTSLKKMQQASLENNLCLVNFAPYGRIRCMSSTAQPADVLIQAGAASHRRARTPQWSYHFYPEESHTELTIQLPSAVLLREVHLQPHLSTLATCPSAVALETSPDGPSRLTPACPPLPTSGMTFIRMHLPVPEVVNCVQLRLYKPRDASNIGLSQIRLLGTSAFGGASKQQPDLNDDESHCRHSLGWLRLLHYCLMLPRNETIKKRIIAAASCNPDTLQTLTGLLLVPSHVPSPYLPNLEKIITELSLANYEMSLQVIGYILSTKMHLNDTLSASNSATGRFLTTNSAAQSTCEVLQQICTFENGDTWRRIDYLLNWTKNAAQTGAETNRLDTVNSLYISTISSILWTTYEAKKTDVTSMVTEDLFNAVFELSKLCKSQSHLKFALDSLLCAICYIRNEFFAKLLEKLEVLQEKTVVDHFCSVSDDRKDSSGLTDDTKRIYSENSEWYERLTIRSLNELDLDAKKLETLALCSRSQSSIRQLLDSQLPKLLNMAIVEFTRQKAHVSTHKSDNVHTSASSAHINVENAHTSTNHDHRTSNHVGNDTAHASWHLNASDLTLIENSANNSSFLDGSAWLRHTNTNGANDTFTSANVHGCTGLAHTSANSRLYSGSAAHTSANNSNSVHINACNSNSAYVNVAPAHTSANTTFQMGTLKRVTAILRFFCEVSEEKLMRDYLGSKEGSMFLLPLLNFLCAPRKATNTTKSYLNGYDGQESAGFKQQEGLLNHDTLRSESYTFLEEATVKLLSKMCLCHPQNQLLLSKALCEVISKQTNGISGFLRRLILQLLLENEKVPVSVEAEETIYKNSSYLHPYVLLHPAFKHAHNRALLYLGTNVTLAEILEKYVLFSTNLKAEPSLIKKELSAKAEGILNFFSLTVDSDLSMAAGVTAKDKRIKTSTPIDKFNNFSDGYTGLDSSDGRSIQCLNLPDANLPVNITLGQLLRLIEEKGAPPDWPCIHLSISSSKQKSDEISKEIYAATLETQPALESALQVFSSLGGLALLAQHLPTVYPDTIVAPNLEKPVPELIESDWVKVDALSDNIYEDIDENSTGTPPKNAVGNTNVPPHSLTAFGLFLRLPGYAEVLLKDSKKALCLLRLVLGVTDDGEGGNIFQTSVADSLPTLPFEMLRMLYDSTPLSTDDGRLLRRTSINIGVVHLLLGCLAVFTHQIQVSNNKESKSRDEREQLYWAKGTGFGTGSTQQSWNVEQALLKQKSEEEHVTVLLQVLASYINPNSTNTDALQGTVLPSNFTGLLLKSALLPALSSYLRNDSVLDMARHIPLYKAALKLLRAIAVSTQLLGLLMPQKNSQTPSIASLLKTMKSCMDTYASKLKMAQINKTGQKKSATSTKPFSTKMKLKADQLEELDRDEGLAVLMPDIQFTAGLVCAATERLKGTDLDTAKETYLENSLSMSFEEERYLKMMKKLQFDTYEMIQEIPEGGYKFVISHHFESNAREAGEASHPARVKRLAQEAVTLATSLPLSYSSSVFVRCDTDRLDIMKVLITGPADTPYANGCFELDVFFPPNYPLAPMMINLETTGHHTVRFNPNLYNDGKVCLSVLNTWQGRPEEKWNAQTSSFLQVLVSIQSLILVPEPYFNEPGYERSRGTPTGTQSSKDYNANISLATVRWAMLEQIVNPCPCFKDVIHAHFYLKRQEIMQQVESWIRDLENDQSEKRTIKSSKRSTFSSIETFKEVYQQLKEKLLKLQAPAGTSEDPPTPQGPPSDPLGIESDVEMQKMVNDMIE